MAKKVNKPNTGFKNGDLFCFNCGQSHKIHLPENTFEYASVIQLFDKLHAYCEKTWADPDVHETEGMTLDGKISWWVLHGDKEFSTNVMLFRFMGRPLPTLKAPSYPDDFRRCHQLLKAVPEFRKRLHELKDISPTWSNLVDNWDKLTGMLEREMATGEKTDMMQFMKFLGC